MLTRQQALERGITRDQWAWQLERRRFQRLLPGVVVVHNGQPTEREKAWAACLYGGSGTALSGDAALVAHGFRARLPERFDLVIPPARRVLPQTFEGGEAVVVRRIKHLDPWRAARRGLPLLNVHVAALHAAAWAETDRSAEWRVAAVVQQRLSVPSLMRDPLAGMPSLRRRALLLSVLADVELGAHAASELAFLRLCREFALPRPDALQLKVRSTGTCYLDARYDRQRVTVEVDGAHHRMVEHWEQDALRALRVSAHLVGERVLRLTPSMLRHDRAEVSELLRAILS